MHTSNILGWIALLSLASCRDECSSSSDAPRSVVTPVHAQVDAQASAPADAGFHPTPEGCAAPDESIYLLGALPTDKSTTVLYRFDPRSRETTRLGRIPCDPFSIAVDRHGVVWGEGVDRMLQTLDAAHDTCHATSHVKDQHGFEHFYLAFVRDPDAQFGESLYASDEHYEHGDPAPSRGLGKFDVTLALHVLGAYDSPGPFKNAPCAIAGTGDGRLFAECNGDIWRAGIPGADSKVALKSIPGEKSWLQKLNARPFAFWGGSLWYFSHPCDTGDCDSGSHITEFDIATGLARDVGIALPIIVSAATSSTCAPL